MKMRNTRYPITADRPEGAAMFIDYNSLYEAVEERVGKRAYPDDVILEMISELQRHIMRDFGCEVGYCRAFADFSQLGDHAGHVQRELAHNGVEPRFVASTIQPNAPENILNYEVGRLLGGGCAETTIVILTGTRVYHVLANAVGQSGKQVIVLPVGMDGEVSDRDVHPMVRYVSAALLLSDAVKRALGADDTDAGLDELEPKEAPASRSNVTYESMVDPASIRTLEIVEEYFGQYDEVYLTPLLRKLSEEFGEHDYDPKTVINGLELAGAVWLEKRRGFPYDYTVLILDSNHPDVKALRSEATPDEEWQAETFQDANGAHTESFDDPGTVSSGTSMTEADNG